MLCNSKRRGQARRGSSCLRGERSCHSKRQSGCKKIHRGVGLDLDDMETLGSKRGQCRRFNEELLDRDQYMALREELKEEIKKELKDLED